MSDTPTPRTDAIAHQGLGSVAYIAEMTDFARQLERELAEVTQSLAFQTQLNREVIEREKQTHAELAAERALADRLGNAIRRWSETEGYDFTPLTADEALAAWKEARRGTV